MSDKRKTYILDFLSAFSILAAVVLGTVITISAEQDVSYTALGDSISSGYGLSNSEECYVSMVSSELNLKSQNLGIPGLKSGQLLESLKNLRGKELEGLKKSKLITVSIGSNDILIPFLNIFKSPKIFSDMNINTLKENPESFFYTVEDIIYDKLEEYLKPNIEEFYKNLPQIVSEIKNINPDAKIIFIDFYNPFKNIEVPQISFGLNEIADKFICSLNETLYSDNGEYFIAPVYDAFENAYANGNNPVNVTASSLITDFKFDPHPNAYGHILIKDAVLNVENIIAAASTDNQSAINVIADKSTDNSEMSENPVTDKNPVTGENQNTVSTFVLIFLAVLVAGTTFTLLKTILK